MYIKGEMPTQQRSSALQNLPLILDLIEWVARTPRSRAELIEVWGTSCPRFPVWEDALASGLVSRTLQPGAAEMISVTDAGREFLRSHGR